VTAGRTDVIVCAESASRSAARLLERIAGVKRQSSGHLGLGAVRRRKVCRIVMELKARCDTDIVAEQPLQADSDAAVVYGVINLA